MIFCCKDGVFYRDPTWTNEHLQVMCEDEQVFVLYPKKVTVQVVRRWGCAHGFYFKAFRPAGIKQIIWAGRWKTMYAYTGTPSGTFPKPDVHNGCSRDSFAEDGELVWT